MPMIGLAFALLLLVIALCSAVMAKYAPLLLYWLRVRGKCSLWVQDAAIVWCLSTSLLLQTVYRLVLQDDNTPPAIFFGGYGLAAVGLYLWLERRAWMLGSGKRIRTLRRHLLALVVLCVVAGFIVARMV